MKRPMIGVDGMRLSTAVVEVSITIEIAHITHAVPEGLAVKDLPPFVGVGAVKILRTNALTLNDNLTDFSSGKGLAFLDRPDRIIGGPDNSDRNSANRSTNGSSPLARDSSHPRMS